MEKVKSELVPSLISGGLAVGIYSMILQEPINRTIAFAGLDVPVYVAVGSTSMISHLVGTGLEDFVLKRLPQSPSLEKIEAVLVKPSIGGLAMYGMGKLAISPYTPFLPAFTLGAASIMGGDYLSKGVVKLM